MLTAELTKLSKKLIMDCQRSHIKIATAESCTGGLLASYLTSIPGSSDIFERGYITYSNDAKVEMLGVPSDMILTLGAVSPDVAIAMCEGALKKASVHLTVAVTGIAGPGGGTSEKPVGTVNIASARLGGPTLNECHIFSGNRDQVRQSSVKEALNMMLKQI